MLLESLCLARATFPGQSLRLPEVLCHLLSGDLESEQLVRDQLQAKLGVDPLDIEAVMEISFPRP